VTVSTKVLIARAATIKLDWMEGKYSIESFPDGGEGAGIEKILVRHDNLTVARTLYKVAAPLSVRQPDVAVQENGTLRDKAKPLAPNADGFAVSRIAAARPAVSIACGMSAFDPKRTSAAQKEGPPSLGGETQRR
jgi:hypothetical protein